MTWFYAALAAAPIVLVFLAVTLRIISATIDEIRMQNRILDLFAVMASSDGSVAETGIDADWLALKLCGFPIETRIRDLPAEQQAKVVDLSERTRRLAAKMVAVGILDYFRFSVPTAVKLRDGQKVNPPGTLFILSPVGRAEVLRRRAAMKIGVNG